MRCVANLVQKGRVKGIFYNSSHALYKKGMGYTYEVDFVRAGRSRRRRFTVYKLSGIHAKSDCYQVTDPYGEYIVIKIPPQPIAEIDAYLDAVIHERILARKLSGLGVKVVVPCVSPVMRHLYKFEAAEKMSPGELEDAYMQLLRTPGNEYAQYLKIGGTFVFFLEFLEEPFLGNIVREFYHKELLENIKKDHIERDIELIHNDDRRAFLGEYKDVGTKQVINEIFDGLMQSYRTFSGTIDALSAEYSLQLEYSKRRDLFIAKIMGRTIDEPFLLTLPDMDQASYKRITDQLNDLIISPVHASPAFTRYNEILEQEVNWLAFKYSSLKVQKIGDNILALLAKLEEMGLVLRDLKVDNLFITDIENMELGVIDLETGGEIGAGATEHLVPAGMPGNMTVSNLLFVRQLRSIYGLASVEEILHVQDWYATVAMIFEAVAGLTLFDEARDYIIKIIKEIDEKVAINYCNFKHDNPGVELSQDLIETFFMLSDEEIKGHTWNFFALAKRDLKKKSFTYGPRLKKIKFRIPDRLKRKILDKIEKQCKRAEHEIHSFRLTDISGEYLDVLNTPIHVLKNNLLLKQQLHATFKTNPSIIETKIAELAGEVDAYQRFIALKQKEILLNKKKCLLSQEQISALALFPIMLDFIIEIMCREEWQQYRPKLSPARHGVKNKRTIDAAADWKSAFVPTKNELSGWLQASRQIGINNLGLYSPSLVLPAAAERDDEKKTVKKSFL